MMRQLKTLLYALAAGVCIGLGGTVYLSLLPSGARIAGALFFTIGLFAICTNGFFLFTGKVCYLFEQKPAYLAELALIWLGNLGGTWLTARLLLATRQGAALQAAAAGLCEAKLGDSLGSLFILAIFCNMCIFLAVDGFRRNPHELGKYLALFLGVAVFILCGFEHCVANMFYFSMGGVWSGRAALCLLVMTLGNALGGVLPALLRRWGGKIE